MLTPPFPKHTVTFTINSVLYSMTPPLSKNHQNCGRPSWLGPAPALSALTNQAETGRKSKIRRCPPNRPFGYTQSELLRQAQDKLFLSGQAIHGHQLNYFCLYQISCFPVKQNPLILLALNTLIQFCNLKLEQSGSRSDSGDTPVFH